MTVKPDWLAERTNQELARGREIAARNAAIDTAGKSAEDRQEALARYTEIKDGQFKVSHDGKNRVAKIWHEGEWVPVAAEVAGPAFPTQGFIINCALAVMSLIPPQDVPDYSQAKATRMAERKRRDEWRDRNAATGWKALHEPK